MSKQINALPSLQVALCANAFAQGTVVDSSFFSPALGVSKDYRVYLPAGYSASDVRYPVIYLLHGCGVTERSWTETLDVDDVADRIGLQAIIVMPDGDRSFYVNSVSPVGYEKCLSEVNSSLNPTEPRESFCVRVPHYEDYIVADLVSEIDAKFRAVPSWLGRALSGESAGGLGALHSGASQPGSFLVCGQPFRTHRSALRRTTSIHAGPVPVQVPRFRGKCARPSLEEEDI